LHTGLAVFGETDDVIGARHGDYQWERLCKV
jgi:hypothetical protein